jgi:multimeric flavodoxin WrbA
MKITVITSSPRKKGTSALLADEFMRGAREAGHNVFRFDGAFEKVSPCRACDHCRKTGLCAQKDSMEKLNPHVLEADVLVFVTPLYYYGMSAQLKTVIDRFYANDSRLNGSGKRAVLLATSAGSEDWAMQALVSHYETILKYEQWANAGMILAVGCSERSDIEHSAFPNQAYLMGKEIGNK